MDFDLKGKIAIVTGAIGLIGKEHCRALVEHGATLIATDIDETEVVNFAKSLGENALGYAMDITNPESIKKVCDTVYEQFGSIDILVNNAAINDMVEDPKSSLELSKFENYPLELWEKSIKVNLTGTFLCCQLFGKKMVEQGRGSVINIASTYGLVAPDQSLYLDENENQIFFKPPAYPVSKAGVVMLTKYLASYWGNKGIRVNCISPGGVENGQNTHFIKKYTQKTPSKRMAHSTDFRGALIYLASDASKYTNGANIVVDGGWSIW